MGRLTDFVSEAGASVTADRFTARTFERRLVAPVERTLTRVVRARAARFVRSLIVLLALFAAVIGTSGLTLGLVGYSSTKSWADRLASDGSFERFTPDLHAQLLPWFWATGVASVLLAGMLFLRRAPLQRRLFDAAAGAAIAAEDGLETSAAGPAPRSLMAASMVTALAFWVLYLCLGVALWFTGVFDHFDGIFSADPPRVIRDLAMAGADGGRSHLHPLFVLFFNPIGSALATLLGSKTATALVMTSSVGAASVFLCQLFFHRIGMPLRLAVLWSFLLGLTASHLVFSAIPETCIFSAPPTIACCILARRRSRFLPFVGTSIAAVGVTSTNLATSVLLYLFSRRRSFGASVLRAAGLVVVVIAGAVGLAVLQKAVFPHTKLFFSPAAYRAAVFEFMPDLHHWSNVRHRADDVARHMFVYTVIAPVPHIKQTGEQLGIGVAAGPQFVCPKVCAEAHLADGRIRPSDSHPAEITFQSSGPVQMLPVGEVGAAVWLGVLLCAVYEMARDRRRSGLLAGIAAGLAFQFVLHLVYGDDLFLYSSHWAFLLVAGVAVALRDHWHRSWLTFAVALLLVAEVLNNVAFANGMRVLFSHQHL